MRSVRKLFVLVVPAMLVGALVLGSAPGFADDGRIAQGPTPPRPPRPPRAPTPPHPPDISISINGNKIDLSGIEGMVRRQLDGAREMIRNNPNIPPQVRDKILARLDRVRASVDKRLAKLKTKGVDQLGE
ncbi:MAG TPA: hypothetical protein VFO79_01215, partial [Xanthomonadales bacterium]|nr:hypothetical protein [Xanthomonadales bacterium]